VKSTLTRLPKFANQFGKAIKDAGIFYAALAPALPEFPRSYQVIPEAIAASEGYFL
jgi:hypothetical protein